MTQGFVISIPALISVDGVTIDTNLSGAIEIKDGAVNEDKQGDLIYTGANKNNLLTQLQASTNTTNAGRFILNVVSGGVNFHGGQLTTDNITDACLVIIIADGVTIFDGSFKNEDGTIQESHFNFPAIKASDSLSIWIAPNTANTMYTSYQLLYNGV